MAGKIRWSADEPSDAKLVVLNYSGGKQSTCLLHMVLRKEIDPGLPVYVINANPGMEASETYRHVQEAKVLCEAAGVYFETAQGPDLLRDTLTLKDRDTIRLDQAAWFTKSKTGSRGRLLQKCTRYYKIEPMDRAIRRILERDFGIPRKSSRIQPGLVEKWIGMSADEVHRCKPPAQRYLTFRYPLIELGMRKEEVVDWLTANRYEVPCRSVCNGCFAHSLSGLKTMHDNRPEDWAQAVAIDEAIRDLSQIMVNEPVYVSDTLTPLRELAEIGFTRNGQLDMFANVEDSCDSGYCFV